MPFYFLNNVLSETSSVLRIRGSDAYTYLQGQFTQDLNHPVGSAAYGLWLNQKGKVVADGFLLRRDDNDFISASFATRAEPVLSRLESYIVADEVEVADETADWAWLKLWGDGLGEILRSAFGGVPVRGAFAEGSPGLLFHGQFSDPAGFEWLVPRAAVADAVARLDAAGVQPADASAAERERILRAVPAVPGDIGAGDLPNEGGLEDTAICHTKGCYLGQEVMARLKNLGQVRRALHVVRGPGAVPSAHTALFQNGAKIGETRTAAPEGTGFVAMAMLSLVNLDPAAGLATGPSAPPSLKVVRRV
jgi:folate-binding protein YgfZ